MKIVIIVNHNCTQMFNKTLLDEEMLDKLFFMQLRNEKEFIVVLFALLMDSKHMIL